MHDGSDQLVDEPQDQTDHSRSESTPLYLNAPNTGTLRLIVGFFIGFSITVTVALAIQIHYGYSKLILHGGVVSDSKPCSDTGKNILQRGGSAVDAVIATAFCMGVINPHVTGLGSGGYMLVYDQRERKLMSVIDFRVTRGNHSAIGVPGFVAGLALAHKLFGTLSWKKLIEPSVYFARNGFHGFRVSQTLLRSKSALKQNETYNENLKSALNALVADEVIPNPPLADTLDYIATAGSAEFYRNVLVKDLAGILDPRSILDYEALKVSGIQDSFLNYDIITAGPGSGGPLLLDNLKRVNNSVSSLVSAIMSFKLAADEWRLSTASHIAAMDYNDVYVTMVSGLGFVLGSQILSKSGFILNDMLEITSDKKQRPDVLFTPVIALQSKKICGRRLLSGAGDVRDLAQALIQVLRNESGSTAAAIEAPRVRLKARNVIVDPEHRITVEDYKTLSDEFIITENPWLFPSINVIEKINDTITAHADSRGGGNYSIF